MDLKTYQLEKSHYFNLNVNRRNVFILLVIVVVASSILVLINYFTIKMLSAGRAFIYGESSYAKGQKDALYNLVLYIHTEDETRWEMFRENLNIPFGDSLARVALMADEDKSPAIEMGFLQGGNHPDDIGNLIWLFRNFRNFSFMTESAQLWKEADYLNFQVYLKADSIRNVMQRKSITIAEKNNTIQSLDYLNRQLTKKQIAFSRIMSNANREVSFYLFIANFLLIFIIISCVGFYFIIIINRLTHNKREMEHKNLELTKINNDLDNFIYTASHDLKAPIANLEGLLTVLRKKVTPKIEKEEDNLLGLMEASVNRFKNTIMDLTEVTKITKTVNEDLQLVFFNQIIDDVKEDLIKFIRDHNAEITTDLNVKDIYFSKLNIKSILHNLLSNAIKYHFPQRTPVIRISTYREGDHTVLVVSDNGLGFDIAKKDKVFSMFKRLHNHVEGTGLGMYIVKRIIEDAGGKIEVKSEVGVGSEFKLFFPL